MSKGAGTGREISSLERLGTALASGGNALRDFEREGAHLFVDQSVGGTHGETSELIRTSGKISDFAAGFFDQQDASGGVPFLKSEFPEAIEAPRRHRGKIE